LQPTPEIELSRLRNIGWAIWDPIGLRNANAKWRPTDLELLEGEWTDAGALDEYDVYLLQVVSRLRRGEPRNDVAHYLVGIETVDIFGALEPKPPSFERALVTVEAVADYLKSV
jgi:hypothetical protein